ncbi:MAG: hydroxyacylglutathione hydrolase [Pseudomonadota bacterium]
MASIIPFPALKDNYIWLLTDINHRYAAIVDPSKAEPILDYLEQNTLTPIAILITHHHWDHVGGIEDIIQHYTIPVYTPANETVTCSTHPVKEGDIVSLNEINLSLSVIDVPGHTAGAVAYYSDTVVFSGDTLFTAGCGRMFEGTPVQMHHSLEKFKTLNRQSLLYCGHEYTEANLQFALAVEPDNEAIKDRLLDVKRLREQNKPSVPSNISIELETNPFLRCREASVIKAASNYIGESIHQPHEVFAVIRQWKDNF